MAKMQNFLTLPVLLIFRLNIIQSPHCLYAQNKAPLVMGRAILLRLGHTVFMAWLSNFITYTLCPFPFFFFSFMALLAIFV
jgi:hypothetical protein